MPAVEYVTVANHAEALNGLLYLQGAGWTEIRPPVQPNGQRGVAHFGIGLSILVGWVETNQRFPLELTLIHEDGGDPLFQAQAQVEQGRPPGLTHGSDMRSVLALNIETVFPRPGRYEVRADLAGQIKTAVFRVQAPPAVPPWGPTEIDLPPTG